MSIILGLNCNHADSSACIIINGKLIYAIEEEKINRIKHWSGFPINSINECLKHSKINISEITDIALNTNPLSNLQRKANFFLKNYLFGKKKYEIINRIKKKLSIKESINKYYFPKKLSNNVQIHYIDHHLSHISSVFFPSKLNKAIGLSIDGFGDFCSIAIAKCNTKKINIINRLYFPDSLGVFYEAFTQLIGFKNYGDEYKIMGLAPYGKPIFYDEILNNIFDEEKKLKLNLKYFNHTKTNYSYNFKGKPNQKTLLNKNIYKIFSKKKIVDKKKITDQQKNLAASVQKIFEEKLIYILEKIKKINFSKNLVYAGGCALNSSANRLLTNNNKYFKKIYIPSAPGDNGGALGAAFLVYVKKYNKKIKKAQSPYLGNGYSNQDIEKILKKEKYKKKIKYKFITKEKKLFYEISKLIKKGNIIGWFQDKVEFGPRALGNRSILADPRNPKMKEIINKKIKRRESFRPFAPAVLREFQKDWFESNFNNLYMSSVALVKKSKRKLIPSVTHVDGTSRLQTVSMNTNPRFYNLIKQFYKITRVPILLNTSFNENEPIVLRPEEALNCFLRTKMDYLVLNDYLIKK